MRLFFLCSLLLGLAALLPARAADAAPADAGHAVAYAAWSANALFLAAKVDDPLVVGNQTLPMSQPWLDDAVAFYLDLDPASGDTLDRDCLRIIISAAGGATVQRGDAGEWRDEPAFFQPSRFGTIRFATKVDGTLNDSATPDKGFTVEIALAWPLLGVAPPFSEQQGGPPPTIGFAAAAYAQGETQAVSCWPEALTAADLDHPGQWGTLRFLQSLQPEASAARRVSAPLQMGEPFVDGVMRAPEWMMAGPASFAKHWGTVAPAPVAPARGPVSLVAAWYLLDPPVRGTPHTPLLACGPWNDPHTASYHQAQLREARRAGIDALAVVLPLHDSAEAARAALVPLLDALRAYDRAASGLYLRDVPLLLPVLDAAGVAPQALPARVEERLRDFYRLVPPQDRLRLQTAEGGFCDPVVLAAGAPGPLDGAALDAAAARLRDEGVLPGWLLDTALTVAPAPGNVLARCGWNPSAGVQVGEGPLRTALIAPGVATHSGFLARRDGAAYENGWLKIGDVQPDLLLIRSWNDYAQGTEIAPSRQYGYQYVDATRMAILRQANARGFGVRVIGHTLPATLVPGTSYPVELLLKNGGLAKIVTKDGFRVDYRLLQGDQELLRGIATQQVALFELSTARLRFTLPTGRDNRHPLPAGAYRLCLDIRRDKIPFVSLPLMTEFLGTITLPLTLAPGAGAPQLLSADLPVTAGAGTAPAVEFLVRNRGARAWPKGDTLLRLRWRGDAAMPALLPLRSPVMPGDVAVFAGTLPAAPAPGWAELKTELVTAGGAVTPLRDAWVQTTPDDLRVQVIGLKGPTTLDREAPFSVALRNAGLLSWDADTLLTYQWLAWDGTPIPNAAGAMTLPAVVRPGGTTALQLPVAPPAGAGLFRCAVNLERRGVAGSYAALAPQEDPPLLPVLVRGGRWQSVDLAAFAADTAARAETTAVDAGLDGEGNVFPLEEFLPDASNPGIGYPVGYGRVTPDPAWPVFSFPAPARGKAYLVRAAGQTLALPKVAGTAMHLLACAPGPSGPATFTVQYDDESTQTATLGVTNWLDAPAYQEPVMLRSRFLRTKAGEDWYLHGSLFAYRISLQHKPLRALTLPPGGVCLVAVTVETAGE
jgi:hypothetical protein